MNAHGGTLLVGVTDDGQLSGIEADFSLLGKKDRDGWEVWMTSAVSHSLGKAAAAELDVAVVELDGKQVARVVVGPAAEPVFARPPKAPEKATFLVRTNNSTQQLIGQEILDYQKKRWPT